MPLKKVGGLHGTDRRPPHIHFALGSHQGAEWDWGTHTFTSADWEWPPLYQPRDIGLPQGTASPKCVPEGGGNSATDYRPTIRYTLSSCPFLSTLPALSYLGKATSLEPSLPSVTAEALLSALCYTKMGRDEKYSLFTGDLNPSSFPFKNVRPNFSGLAFLQKVFGTNRQTPECTNWW